ncbi:MAG: alanine:cation symporter family protein [Deltaproteobacteria bacterium]|nr:alanine:cation symporter family protein [Deltaproteobacteria bacterium]MBW2530314.1 alanine:cation symporter family protein [Deltaproteobacteria bacterium]
MDGTILATIVELLNHYVWSFPAVLPWMVVLLLLSGLHVTVRLRLIQLRRLGHAARAVLGHFDDPEDEGDISHFQALTTALSATVGIGNIAGVAIAIHYGGPGALFWMWVTALFGMALKYTECTLALHYRSFDARGNVAGGPMYYIEKGLGPRWKPLAMLFALACIVSSFGAGNMNQANTVAVSADSSFGLPAWVVGLVSAALVGLVILGGIQRIAKVTSRLAPMMAAVYVAAALVVIVLQIDEVPAAFVAIVRGAFYPEASLGGSVAGVFMMTLLWGVRRGLFSNEAGEGSAPIAHAAARTEEPVREGAVALLEPFIDTLIICTMTGLVIVTTGVWDEKRDAELGLNEVEALPASLVPAEAPYEAARVRAALSAVQSAREVVARTKGAREQGRMVAAADVAAESRATELLAPRQMKVEQGRIEGMAFIARDGFVDQPRLVAAAMGRGIPFTGQVYWDPGAQRLEALKPAPDVDAPKLRLGGRMLLSSSALTAWAFERGLSPLGDWGSYVVTFSVFLFALSTMISWSYYGDRAVEYLAGHRFVLPYRLVYVAVVYVGSVSALEVVWAYGDLGIAMMTVPNLIAVFLLTPKVVRLTQDYFRRMDARRAEEGT